MKELRGIADNLRTGLSEKEKAIGELLLDEGLNYENLKRKAVRVGKHTSYFVHGRQEMISIHFREGMEELKKLSDRPIALMRLFLKNLKDDLGCLARRLETDPELKDTKEIWGLCALSPKWGERYGFKTKVFEPDLSIVDKHEESIADKPQVDNFAINQALHLFIHTRNNFIKVFRK